MLMTKNSIIIANDQSKFLPIGHIAIRYVIICDRLWENPPYGIFLCKLRYIFDKLYPRANPPASLRVITHFALEIVSFVYDRATRIENKKLWSKGVAMYAYSISVYYARTGSQLIGLGWSCSKMNAKVKLVVNFVINNESCFFFDD